MFVDRYIYIYIYIYIHKQVAAKSSSAGTPIACQVQVRTATFGATQVRAYDDRAIGSFVRNSYVSTFCPVVICPYLRTSETSHP